jgi:hypothetical protein
MRTLATISLDLWLLAQRAPETLLPDGHVFQTAVGDLLRRPGLRCVQHAGLHTLWGLRSASGAAHELDSAARAARAAYLIEAKATNHVGKADLAVFEQKVTDYYFSRWQTVADHRWWSILASAGEVSDAARRVAAHRSILLIDAQRLPLPVILHHVTHRNSRGVLPDQLRCEVTRLAPRALSALQERYVPDIDANCLRMSPRPYTCDEIDDLLWLQDELTEDILDYYETKAPGRLEFRRAEVHRLLQTRRVA